MLRRNALVLAAFVLIPLSFTFTVHAQDKPRVQLETSQGNLVIELEQEKAPKTVANFLRYVDDGFYNGLIFHRVIANFMVQGGGLEPNMKKRPTREPVPNESANGLSNTRGTLAMARTADPHSATAQFFINVVDNPFLDRQQSRDGWGYCVFGRVVSGIEIVDKIRHAPTTRVGGRRDVPQTPVIITRALRVPSQSTKE